MAEPITTTILGVTLWEYLGKPIVDKVKDKYSEKVLDKILSSFEIENDDKNIVKSELLKCNKSTFDNENIFLKFINENKNIQNLVNDKPIFIRSLVDIEDSEIDITPKNPYIQDSLNSIKNSKIKIG